MDDTRSDESLMHAYARGEVAAFTSLYDRHARSVWRFVFRHMRNQAAPGFRRRGAFGFLKPEFYDERLRRGAGRLRCGFLHSLAPDQHDIAVKKRLEVWQKRS